jgi:hypothetical protein
MAMCAPGEHHLGELAGWSSRLAWGMAAVLAAYAGIAAVVATRRPKGAPGKASAVAGAIIALIAAMAAQPVSHLFVTGWLSATPRSPWILVIAVSCVPPLVLGHLLHLAAAPTVGHAAPPRETGEQAPATTGPETSQEAANAAAEAQPETAAGEPGEEPEPQALLSTREFAMRMGVKPSTVNTWVARNKLTPAAKDERGNLFDPADLTG